MSIFAGLEGAVVATDTAGVEDLEFAADVEAAADGLDERADLPFT